MRDQDLNSHFLLQKQYNILNRYIVKLNVLHYSNTFSRGKEENKAMKKKENNMNGSIYRNVHKTESHVNRIDSQMTNCEIR
jgi:hypothetical protein